MAAIEECEKQRLQEELEEALVEANKQSAKLLDCVMTVRRVEVELEKLKKQ
jgi:hypothetical protein